MRGYLQRQPVWGAELRASTISAEPLIGVINAGSSSLTFTVYEGQHAILSGQVGGFGSRPTAKASGADGEGSNRQTSAISRRRHRARCFLPCCPGLKRCWTDAHSPLLVIALFMEACDTLGRNA
jgi:hypothetical protein